MSLSDLLSVMDSLIFISVILWFEAQIILQPSSLDASNQ